MTVKQLLEEIEKCRLSEELFSEDAVVKFWNGEEYKECEAPEFHEHGDGEFHIA